jgi:GTP cyclohydrolase IB
MVAVFVRPGAFACIAEFGPLQLLRPSIDTPRDRGVTDMNAPDPLKSFAYDLPDVQGAADQRHLAIQRVGIKGVRHPLTVRNAAGETQHTVGTWSMDVQLPETKKGTHMSRFVALLEERHDVLDVASLRSLLAKMATKLDAEAGRIDVRYPFFITKSAPVSGVESMLDIEVTLTGRIADGRTDVSVMVVVPVTSLCPCSKEISEYGAHNQRSHVTIEAGLGDTSEIAVEELVRIAEEEASCEVYGLLKRPDEKYVTERAYDNPKFVEDLIRDVVQRLNDEPRIGRYVVEVENFESIHNHSAYARIEHAATTKS